MAQGAHDSTSDLAIRLRSALETRNLDAFGTLLAEDVRWGGPEETPETCHSRSDVLNRLAALSGAGVDTTLLEVVPGVDSILVGFRVNRPAPGGARRGRTVYQVMSVRAGQIADIRAFPGRGVAAAHAGVAIDAGRVPMRVRGVTPILNVSDLAGSFDWFEKLGWAKLWDWSGPGGGPSFGAVGCDGFEIFVCLDGQGGRGRARDASDTEHGVWLSMWVDDVDAVHATCIREGLDVLRPPRDETWGVREMHVRHPDGHVFRVSQGLNRHEHEHEHEHGHDHGH